MTDTVIIELGVGRAGFQAIKGPWQNLAERSGYHFLHFPGWYEAQLANIEDDSSIFFVTVTHSVAGLCAVIPLEKCVVAKGPVKLPILQLFYPNEMGVNDILSCVSLVEYRGLIARKLRQSVGFFAFIRWQCIVQSGCAVRRIILPENARFTHQSKYLDFSQGLEAFWAGYNSRFRKNLQKKMSKAEEAGALSLVCATEGQALQEAFTTFLRVEDSGWKGERGTSVAKQPAKLAYYQTLLQSYSKTQNVQINVLYLDDAAIAAQFGIRIGDRLYLLKIGFSEAHAAISPGYLVLYKLIEEMGRDGVIKAISFVTGVDWIDRWHPAADPVGVAYSDNGLTYSKALLRGMQWYVARRKTTRTVSLAAVGQDDEG